jgi:hypothetical protein
VEKIFARAKALLPCIALGLAAAQTGWAQATGIVITDYSSLNNAVSQGGTSTFSTNVTVNLFGASEVLRVSTNVVLDGSTNSYGTTATISRSSGTGPMFYIEKGGSLTLINLTLSGGLNTNGGAIFNDTNGTLIISNCVFSGNTSTNLTGAAGANGTTQGNNNGGNGGNGLSAAGGAIVSHGVLEVFYSIFNNNTVSAGSGGNGGNGIKSFAFGGNGGNGGSGGSAQGGAIVCTGPVNIFVATDFTDNTCAAGNGGTPGSPASGAFSGNPGSGGTGGSSVGGAIMASGPVWMTNCLFAGNAAVGGNTTSLSQAGGAASGGGLDLSHSTNAAYIENTTFYQNSCRGGDGGGNSNLKLEPAGNGGSAVGGGLASAAALTILTNCTLATNSLTGGAAGTSTTSQSNGVAGLAQGFDLARTAGTLKMANSLLFGGSNSLATNTTATTLTTYVTNTQPNDSGGLTDLGYNLSSDTSVALLAALGSIENEYPIMDTGLSAPGGTVVGLFGGSTASTLAVLPGSPAIGVIPGIPGLSFPAYDQVFQARSTPTTIGAYEYNALDLASASTATNFISQPPLDATNLSGETIVFQVVTNASNGVPAGFQWQFHGTNLMDSKRISGVGSNILTIVSVSTNDAGVYSVLVGSTTLVSNGISTNSATLTVYTPATIEVQPPKTVTPVPGEPLNISVTAIGDAPLTFRWYLDQTNALSDTSAGITGSASPDLTIYPLTPANAGSYFVVVINQYRAVTSSLVTLSIPPPTLTIRPTLLNVTNPTFNVQGTATGEFGVNVQYRVNGGPWTSATNAAPQTNWSAAVTLRGGTNTFSAYSADPFGQTSKTNTAAIFYLTNSALTLKTNGNGKITPGFAGAGSNLEVGVNYTVTAKPGPGCLFSSWTGPTNTTSNPLTILLESNTTLTANFVSNFFIPAAGTYNGLFSPAGGPTEATAGMISGLTLHTNGVFSGQLLIAGTNYPLAGSFDVSGHASNSFGAASGPGGPLVVDLTLENAPTNQIVGTVSSNSWTANLTAELAAAAKSSAEYTLLFFPPAAAAANSPPGAGYALVTNHAGMITLAGALADGTTFNQTVAPSATGDLPVYASLYKNTGLLFGWINLQSLGFAPPTNALSWIAPSGAASLYPGGFANTLPVQGALWTNPLPNTPAISFANEVLVVSNSALSLTFNVAITTNNALAKLGGVPSNSLTGSINPKTGLLSVTFGNGNGKATNSGTGAVLQTSGSAAGFFVAATGAGWISLQPALAPVILQQPAGQSLAPNTPVDLSVQAIGSPPLSYQWRRDGTNLANGGNISGAAASQLSISSPGSADLGSYSVVVSNQYGPVTSSIVTLTVPPPALTIGPTLATVMTPTNTLAGTAAGEFGVTNVQYQLNGGAWTSALTTNQWTNWSATAAWQIGTNIFRAFSVDPVGQTSPIASAAVFYAVNSPLTLQTSGSGTISRSFPNNNLALDANYTVTAVPNPGWLFSIWTGATNTIINPLTFLMVSNMTLQANFVTNIFLSFAGTYNGLFSAVGGVAEETAGMLYNLVLTTNGTYSAKLYIAGTNYTFGSSFQASGQSSVGIGLASAPGGPLWVDLTLTNAPADEIVGTVSNTLWTANLTAELAGNNLPSAEYTILFSPFNDLANTPPGAGYALVTNHAGTVTLTGALADGTSYNSQVVPASAAGDVPVYASLYGNTGLLLGWINLTNLQAAPPSNLLTWIRKPSGATALYTNGFTNTLSLQGALWTNPPPNTPAISFPKGDLWISNAAFNLDFKVAVLGDNSLAKLGGDPSNSLAGSIVAKTGQLQVTFGNGNGTAATQGLGAVLQPSNSAAGFFLTATNAGALLLQPPAP